MSASILDQVNSDFGLVEAPPPVAPVALAPAAPASPLSYRALFRIPIVGVACYLAYLLLPLFMLMFLGALLSVSLEPLVRHLTAMMGRKAAVGVILAFCITLVVAFSLSVIPDLTQQVSSLVDQAPFVMQKITDKIPFLAPYLARLPQRISTVDASAIAPVLFELASYGGMAAAAFASFFIVFAFTFYFLLDGPRMHRWFLAFLSRPAKRKVDETFRRVVPVISAYVIGQLVTSLLCGVVTFLAFKALHVPAALLFGVTAAVLDTLPIVGFILFAVPTALFSLTVSPQAAVVMVVVLFAYHMIETYLIAPLIYGKRLKVSGTVVLTSLIAGGIVGGIVGAISILPVVASYPIVEEIWLGPWLGRKTIIKHTGIVS